MRFRTAGLASLAWLGLSIGAKAAEPTAAPPPKLQGLAQLTCQAAVDGSLSGCQVISESPPGQGLGDAALKLATTLRLKPAAAGETSPRAVTVPFRFDLADPAAMATADEIKNPNWVAAADAPQIAKYYPVSAHDRHVGGRATVRCIVSADGRLHDCVTVSEMPAGENFGVSAAKMSQDLFRMAPTTRDGAPVAGRSITTSIIFGGGPGRQATNETTPPKWISKPDGDDFARVYPAAALAKGLSGRVAIACDINDMGGLEHCEIAREEPAGMGFGQAALKLVPRFRMRLGMNGGITLSGGNITIPINFVAR